MEDVNLKVDAKLLGTVYYENKRKHGLKRRDAKSFSLLLTNPMLSFRYVESYRMLATRVRFALDSENKNILMVTSVSENEGKSTVAANIAVRLRRREKRSSWWTAISASRLSIRFLVLPVRNPVISVLLFRGSRRCGQ